MYAQNNSPDFGLAELVSSLQQRIQSDQDLLSRVMSYWSAERPRQSLNDLDSLTPLDDVEVVTKGKITIGQVKWMARNRDENGLAEAFVKIGRSLHADIPVLVRLIAVNQGKR